MNKSTIMKLVALLIVFFGLITIIEITMRSITNSNNKGNDITPYVPVVSSEEKTKEESFISETNEVLELLKKRDYESIYNRFDELYRKAKYPSLESFKEAMNGIISDDSTIEVSSISNHPLGYFGTFLIDGTKELDVIVENLGRENMTIAFDLIDNISPMSIRTGSNEVSINFNYRIRYYPKVGYSLEVTNETNSPITFDIYKSSHEYTDSKYNKNNYFIEKAIKETINAHATKQIEIQFPVAYSLTFPPDLMELNFGVNNKDYSILLHTSYAEEDEDDDW